MLVDTYVRRCLHLGDESNRLITRQENHTMEQAVALEAALANTSRLVAGITDQRWDAATHVPSGTSTSW